MMVEKMLEGVELQEENVWEVEVEVEVGPKVENWAEDELEWTNYKDHSSVNWKNKEET